MFLKPFRDPFYPTGVHFNQQGQFKLYRSYRGAMLSALRVLERLDNL